MTKVIIPRGYIWLREVTQDFKWRYIELKRQVGTLNEQYDDWEHDCLTESVGRLQLALVNSDIEALYFGDEDIEKLPRGFWAKEAREDVIRSGIVSYRSHQEVPAFVEFALYKKYLSEYQVLANSQTSGLEASEDVAPNLYLTPFVEMMLRAISSHKISEHYAPPVKQLEAWFAQQTLPDGKPISPNQAKMMATFSRPPHLMKGGHFKATKPSAS